jgi:hypothetical protein
MASVLQYVIIKETHMKNMEQQNKQAALIVGAAALAFIIASFMSGCGQTLRQEQVPGPQGVAGTNGTNGESVVFTTIAASNSQCPTGGQVLVIASDSQGTGVYSALDTNQKSLVTCNGATGSQGATGSTGATGAQGAQGAAGTNGTNGATGATGSQGATGATGAQGPVSAFSPITPITPCGAASSPWKEVLLCLQDGSVLADFSETMAGQDTRLSFIPAGSYEDTDESGCNFSVSVDGSGDTTVSWGAGSNSYSTWTANSVTCKAN